MRLVSRQFGVDSYLILPRDLRFANISGECGYGNDWGKCWGKADLNAADPKMGLNVTPGGAFEYDSYLYALESDTPKLHRLDTLASSGNWMAIKTLTGSGFTYNGVSNVVPVESAYHKVVFFGGPGMSPVIHTIDMDTGVITRGVNTGHTEAIWATALFWFEGTIYLFGGKDSVGGVNAFQSYNLGTDAYTALTKTPTACQDFGWFVNGKHFVVVGGRNSAGTQLAEVWVYDLWADTWTQKDDFPEGPMDFVGGSSVGDYGYVLNSSYEVYSLHNSFWRY